MLFNYLQRRKNIYLKSTYQSFKFESYVLSWRYVVCHDAVGDGCTTTNKSSFRNNFYLLYVFFLSLNIATQLYSFIPWNEYRQNRMLQTMNHIVIMAVWSLLSSFYEKQQYKCNMLYEGTILSFSLESKIIIRLLH